MGGSGQRNGLAGVVGILVHGDNHFIVRGPQPDRETALALVRQWSLIQIAGVNDLSLAQWSITARVPGELAVGGGGAGR